MEVFGAAAGLEGKTLASAIFLTAIALAIVQLLARRRRPNGLSRAESQYFNDQDARRLIISTILAITAAGIWRGSVFDRHAARAVKAAWAYNWLAVGLLLIALLVLAFYDWWALGRYARGQQQALIETGRAEAEAIRERLEKPLENDFERNGSH